MKAPIMVWEFDEAPEHLRAIANMGGDEDWIALVPPAGYSDDMYIMWLEECHFGNRVNRFDLPDGSRLYVSRHA